VPSNRTARKVITSFKAGRMSYQHKIVSPDTRKGELSLLTGNDSLVVQWKEKRSSEMKLEINLNSCTYASYEQVETESSGRVYVLKLKQQNSMIVSHFFFWSQEPVKSDKDVEFCFTINHYLKTIDRDSAPDLELAHFDRAALMETMELPKLFQAKGAQSILASLILQSAAPRPSSPVTDLDKLPNVETKVKKPLLPPWLRRHTHNRGTTLPNSSCSTSLRRLQMLRSRSKAQAKKKN